MKTETSRVVFDEKRVTDSTCGSSKNELMGNWKDNLFFVLVEPSHAGNIGAAARAIKNMGFRNLVLVNPPDDMSEAVTFAHNAMDVLESAHVCMSLDEALSDKNYIVGTTRRRGRRRGVFTPVTQAAPTLRDVASGNRVAILFGREERGLFNEEIGRCGFLITIPASRQQPSINLAQAVMIIAYEIAKSGVKGRDAAGLLTVRPPRFATDEEVSTLFERLGNALELIGYIPGDNPYLRKKILQNMRHFLGRAGLTDWEVNMFHAICGHIEKRLS
jgi:TrmH family RNA methyltransferase